MGAGWEMSHPKPMIFLTSYIAQTVKHKDLAPSELLRELY